jgi:hypothetical protein
VTALVVGLAVAVGLLAVLVAGLLRANAEVIRTLHGMGADLDPTRTATAGPAPVSLGPTQTRPTPGRPDATDVIDLSGVSPAGDAISLAVAGVRHDTLVGFLTSGCQTCRGFWDAFRDGSNPVPGGARLVVVTRGPEAESPGAIAGLAGPSLAVVMSTEAWEHYDIPYAPYFVYVSGPAGRVVGEGVAAGWEEVRKLVANAVADGTTGPASPGRSRSKADRERDAAVDQVLEEAGIGPGDPRLHPTSIDASDPTASHPTASQPTK